MLILRVHKTKFYARYTPNLPDIFDGVVCGPKTIARYAIEPRVSLSELDSRLNKWKGLHPSILYINEITQRFTTGWSICEAPKGLCGEWGLMHSVSLVKSRVDWPLWICDHSIHDLHKWSRIVFLAKSLDLQGVGLNLHIDLNPLTPDRKGHWRSAAWNTVMPLILRRTAAHCKKMGLEWGITELSVFGLGNDKIYEEIITAAIECEAEFVCFWNPIHDGSKHGAWHWSQDWDGSDSCLFTPRGEWRMSWNLEQLRSTRVNPSTAAHSIAL